MQRLHVGAKHCLNLQGQDQHCPQAGQHRNNAQLDGLAMIVRGSAHLLDAVIQRLVVQIRQAADRLPGAGHLVEGDIRRRQPVLRLRVLDTGPETTDMRLNWVLQVGSQMLYVRELYQDAIPRH